MRKSLENLTKNEFYSTRIIAEKSISFELFDFLMTKEVIKIFEDNSIFFQTIINNEAIQQFEAVISDIDEIESTDNLILQLNDLISQDNENNDPNISEIIELINTFIHANSEGDFSEILLYVC